MLQRIVRDERGLIKVRHVLGTAIFAAGCVWCWNVVPNEFRPSVANSPLHKSAQTITVDVASPTSLVVDPSNHTFKVACSVPTMLHPVEGKPQSVHILFRYAGTIVGDTTMPCPQT